MKWIKLFEEFQMGDLNFMSPEEIQKLFMQECGKQTPDLNLIRDSLFYDIMALAFTWVDCILLGVNLYYLGDFVVYRGF